MAPAAADSLRRLAQRDVRSAQHRTWIRMAEGRKPFHLLQGRQSQRAEGHFGIDLELGRACRVADLAASMLTKLRAKIIDARFIDLQSGRGRVTAVAEQVFFA